MLAVESHAGVHAIADSQAIVVGSKYFFWKDRRQYLRRGFKRRTGWLKVV